MKIAGLDIGTTGCKLSVFDENGIYLDRSYRDYPSLRGDEQTIDASLIKDAVFAVCKDMAEKYPDIAGIGVTSFGETFVLTDEAGNVLLESMLYTDPRGKEQCERLTKELGEETIETISGLKPHEMYSLPKIMWVKENQPEVWAKVKHIFLMEDFIVHALTGVSQIDYSLATRTMAFDIKHLCFSDKILNTAGVDASLFSKPVPTGTSAGAVTKDTAFKTGLSRDTIVVSIGHDQIAACIGAGANDADIATDGAGTVQCLTPIYDHEPDPEIMAEGSYCIVPYILEGTYVTYAFSYTGGALLNWCVDTLAKEEKRTAKENGDSVNQYLEKLYAQNHEANRPTGMLVLPHFAGAATPYMDTGSKGVIVGLTAGTTVEEIYRACMEGVVYEMMLNYERVKETGLHVRKIHATGGGAKSKVWMQMKADVLNLPITAMETVDAGTVGSAMLTGIACGVFQDLKEAADHMIVPVHTYTPDAKAHEAYMDVYARYRKLYEAVRPLMGKEQA